MENLWKCVHNTLRGRHIFTVLFIAVQGVFPAAWCSADVLFPVGAERALTLFQVSHLVPSNIPLPSYLPPPLLLPTSLPTSHPPILPPTSLPFPPPLTPPLTGLTALYFHLPWPPPRFDGQLILPYMTPAQLELEEGDIVDVFLTRSHTVQWLNYVSSFISTFIITRWRWIYLYISGLVREGRGGGASLPMRGEGRQEDSIVEWNEGKKEKNLHSWSAYQAEPFKTSWMCGLKISHWELPSTENVFLSLGVPNQIQGTSNLMENYKRLIVRLKKEANRL